MLLYVGEDIEYKLTGDCGVAEVWQDRRIPLPNGARLARGDYFNVTPSDHALIRFKENTDYDRGVFTVSENSEDGFYFSVQAATDVHRFVRAPSENKDLRAAILTGIVARCFSILQERYKPSEVDEYESVIDDFPNLKVLSAKMIEKLEHDWTDDNFDPMLAATMMYPAQVPALQATEDDEDE